MYICICIYIYMYVYIYIYVCIYMYIYAELLTMIHVLISYLNGSEAKLPNVYCLMKIKCFE